MIAPMKSGINASYAAMWDERRALLVRLPSGAALPPEWRLAEQ
jgi:hypothetical protein